MSLILRQSTQIVVRIGPVVAVGDGFTPVTSLSLSTADEAELLKAAGAGTVDISGATFAAVTGADGWYDLTLTTSHTDTVGEVIVAINDDSLCLPVCARFQIVEEAIYDAFYAASATGLLPANTTQIGGQAVGLSSDNRLRVDVAEWNDVPLSTTNPLPNAAANANGGLPILSVSGTTLGYTITTAANLTTNNDKTGYSLTAGTGLGNQTADITGNLSGSVGSVTGAVGSVTGAVGSVTGNVGGNVAGSVASVTGAVGSVTGAVGSVTGDVGGKVLGGGSGTITGAGVYAVGPLGVALAINSTVTNLGTALQGYVQLICRSDPGIAADQVVLLNAINQDMGSGAGDYDNTTQSQEALRARGDSAWATATGFATPTNVTDAVTSIKGADGDTLETLSDQLDALPQTIRLKKNTALSGFAFPMLDASDDPATGLTVTGQVSKDGGAFGNLTNAVSEISAGAYKVDLAAGDTNGNDLLFKFTATGAKTLFLKAVTSQ